MAKFYVYQKAATYAAGTLFVLLASGAFLTPATPAEVKGFLAAACVCYPAAQALMPLYWLISNRKLEEPFARRLNRYLVASMTMASMVTLSAHQIFPFARGEVSIRWRFDAVSFVPVIMLESVISVWGLWLLKSIEETRA